MKRSKLETVVGTQHSRELMIVICTIFVAASAQIVFYTDAVYRAALSEPFSLMQPLRDQIVERLAFTGRWEASNADEVVGLAPNPPLSKGTRSKHIASVRELEEAHAGLARTEALAAEIEGLGSRRHTSSNAMVGLSDDIPTAVVASSFISTPSLIELRPVLNPAAPIVVNWLCGQQQEFAGVATRAPREPAIPTHLLPFPCRVRL